MITLNNSVFSAKINPKGAELISLYNVEKDIEYLWNGNPQYWNKHSPVLFPIIGLLKDGFYIYKGSKYHLPRHGFARDMEFNLENANGLDATLSLKSSNQTLLYYPFEFELKLHYSLSLNGLSLTYTVINPTEHELFFSIGGHPAFNVPYLPSTQLEDYYLEFEQLELAGTEQSSSGLMNGEMKPFLNNEKQIKVTTELFADDALVFSNIKSGSISLLNIITKDVLKFSFKGFPYFALWSAIDAPFICFEPWAGVPDYVDCDHDIEHKQEIVKLTAYEKWQKGWKVEIV